MPKEVVHLSFSSSGGAGKVATQLSQSQSALGWNSRLVTGIEGNLHSEPFAHPLHTLAASIDNYVIRKSQFQSLVSLSRNHLSLIGDQDLKKEAILHLHWINGLIALERLPERAKKQPVVWTLHDMNPFTGACHQAFGCEGFMTDCGVCPAVRQFAWRSVEKSLIRKVRTLDTFTNLTVVATSPWIATQARASAVFSTAKIETIPNPLRPEFFAPHVEPNQETPYLLVVASDTSDPLKNIDFVVDVFTSLSPRYPDLSLHIVGSNASRFQGKNIVSFDNLSAEQLSQQMSSSVALLVPSLAETAPLVIAEATASGVQVVANDIPSLRHMVEWVGSGLLAEGFDQWCETVEKIVQSALATGVSEKKRAARRVAAQMFDPMVVARQYIDLYERIS